MSTDLPITEIADGVLTFTFNRPERLNAITSDIYAHIADHVSAASTDEDIKVIVLKGNGRAFSSGFDLKLQTGNRTVEQKINSLQLTANRARWAIWNCRKPVIAAVHGYCVGGALELVLPTDLTISTESCRFAVPEILFGAGPAFNMFPWLMNHKKAKSILLLGEQFSAADAYDAGLVTKVVPDTDLASETQKCVDQLLRMPRGAVWFNKQGVNRAFETSGMIAHINSWAETVAILGQIPDPTRESFSRKVQEEGASAGIKWRSDHYSKGAGN
ncbi:enoyl-CoA hydratase/isomerase family protein [Mesorhizobium sp. CAU 1732]|uniref:enoyl-CoA hydratase/isomerase family protein n=1 Tax=Mesorhizobium sp. CAU 1732 TaxID=3140358 RepID=UPI003261562D